jgi:hypothetical protein
MLNGRRAMITDIVIIEHAGQHLSAERMSRIWHAPFWSLELVYMKYVPHS